MKHRLSPRALLIAFALACAVPLAAQEATPEATETASTAECEAGFRLITHVRGETCVPAQPQHVASLDITIYELLLLTGVRPAVQTEVVISAFYERAHPELVEEIRALSADVPDIGFPPNFEVLAESAPDLIIGVEDVITDEIYPLLTQIAPTLVIRAAQGDWRSRITQAGDALNITEQVDALLATYDARVAEFQALMGENLSEIEVSLVRVFPDQIGIMLTGSVADWVIQDVGLARPEAQVRDYNFVLTELAGRAELTISRENLPLANGDLVFAFGAPDEVLDDPLWQQLEAVQAGDAHAVGYYWYVDGLISVHDMLDDLFQYIAGTESTIPNPFENTLVPLTASATEAAS